MVRRKPMQHRASHSKEPSMSTQVEAAGELERANLRTEVAVWVTPLVFDMLEDLDRCLLVVDDIVSCWLLLPPSAREPHPSCPNYPPLSRFVSLYFDEVNLAWAGDCQEDAERLCWRKHAAQLQERAATSEQPSEVWVERLTWLAHHDDGQDGP
jgi:hypothetical protein